jgi:hypothetical protein
MYHNPKANKLSVMPRDHESSALLAKKICRDLEIPEPTLQAHVSPDAAILCYAT